MFGGPDRDEEFAAKKADELVARYIAQRSQSAAPTKATHPRHRQARRRSEGGADRSEEPHMGFDAP